MASQKDQIQSLIADIDGLLNKASPRLPWVMANDTTHQRQVLERVRNFLVSLQRKVEIEDSINQPRVRRDLMAHDIYYQSPSVPASDVAAIDSRQPEAAQQILQSVVQEMSYLRESLMQPLQDDVAALRQQRDTLTQEIRQLETQRQSYSLLQQQANQSHFSNEMLQAYLGRLQDNLSQQIQALGQTQGQPIYAAEVLPEGRSPALPAGDSLPLLNPTQRLEQAQLLQAQSDQLLMNLDSTLRTVFETLQRNVQGYQESLSQGVDRMHSLGQQGEMMFTALISHLAQQLGREASSYVQQPATVAELPSPVNPAISPSTTGQSTLGQSAIAGNRFKPSIAPSTIPQPPTAAAGVPPSIANLNLPFPGTELPPEQRSNLAAMGGTAALPNVDSPPEFADLGLPDLELEELDLTEFGLDPADNQAIDALLNSDTFATDAGAVDETLRGTVSRPPSPAFSSPDVAETDLDAALKLLEQLSSELQAEPSATPTLKIGQPPLPSSTAPDTDSLAIAEDTELEALYESLFGATDEMATDEIAMDEGEVAIAFDEEEGVVEVEEDAVDFEEIGTERDWQAVATPSVDEVDQFDEVSFEQPDVMTADSVEIAPEPFLDLAFESEADTAQLLAPIADETPEVMGGWDEFLIAETVTDEPIAAGESDLFDRGFAEPDATSPFDDPEITLDLSQSLEVDEIGSQPTQMDEISSLTDLFVSEPDEIDLTTALSDIPVSQADSSASPSHPPEVSPTQPSDTIALEEPQAAPPGFDAAPAPVGSTEESYIPAAPEESLLPGDRPDNSEPNLWLDENTLSQLSQDLSRLEGMEGFESVTEETPTSEPRESLDFGFADWGADQPIAETPATSDLELDDALLAELSAALPDASIVSETPPVPSANPEPVNASEADVAEFPAEPTLSTSAFEQPAEPKSGQEFGLTLAAMNELFADLLEEAESDASATVQATEQGDNLTLDGLNSFLEDLPQPASPPSPPEVSPEVTLEGMENLFAEAPTADAAPTAQDATLDNAFGEFAEAQPEAAPAPPDDEDSQKKKLTTAAQVEELPPPGEDAEVSQQSRWYLGIDFGTTQLSAVLLDQATRKLYALYWRVDRPTDATDDRTYRLPAIAYFSPDQLTEQETLQTPAAVGLAGLTLATQHQTQVAQRAESTTLERSGAILSNFKPCLRIGILPSFPLSLEGEAVLQWTDQQPIPLSWVQQALQALFATLTPDYILPESNSSNTPASLSIHADDLDRDTLIEALSNLQGVILGYPVNWSDTYGFNLREAILGAGLVAQPEQVFLVEDAIAALLTELPQTNGEASLLPNSFWQHRTANGVSIGGREATWQGGTLVIDAGAIKTDLILVNLTQTGQSLSYTDFSLRSLAYAGIAIDQDIICQLLYPQWASVGDRHHPFFKAIGYLFHPSLTLPVVADPDFRTRYRLQQRLEGSPLGRNLLEAARHLKQVLQQQETFVFELDRQSWTVQRQALENQVYVPYLQRLNRELNALLSYTGFSTPAIQQVICTGGTGRLPALIHWLRQKLPNAVIMQDVGGENSLPSRVAFGLAIVPLYPQVLDISRQQYSDYFLLLELLRTLPNEALSLGKIMQLLEHRGINTRACQFRLLALLEGHLPPGLVPSQSDAALLTNESRQNSDYRAIAATQPFIKHGNQTYEPNQEQCDLLRRYLEQRLQGAYQQLEEPLTVDLGVGILT